MFARSYMRLWESSDSCKPSKYYRSLTRFFRVFCSIYSNYTGNELLYQNVSLIKVNKSGYLFFSALYVGLRPLGSLAPKILSLQFQGIGWCDRDEVLKLSAKMYFKNTTFIINNIHYTIYNIQYTLLIFCIIFVQGTFST